ncbi:hypothetical protein BVY00_00585 [bacterium G20]|nr:hypothetical protein BVY00_00585 [bacterium G20]
MPTSYKFLITKRAKQDLDKLPVTIRKRIRDKLQFFIANDEPLHFAEKLKERKEGDYRFRIGAYRIVVIVEEKIIYIVRVQHRREVYRK